jgi:hypothetical protein
MLCGEKRRQGRGNNAWCDGFAGKVVDVVLLQFCLVLYLAFVLQVFVRSYIQNMLSNLCPERGCRTNPIRLQASYRYKTDTASSW